MNDEKTTVYDIAAWVTWLLTLALAAWLLVGGR
jgi:hypothetical protein